MNDTTTRPLHEIAAEIYATWRNAAGKSTIYFGAVPYVEAMAQLDSITDMFYADRASDIVVYFLGNANTWRGEDAKRIKAELREMIK